MKSLAQLRKNSSKSFEALKSKIDGLDNKKDKSADDRFWKPTLDKAGNARAIIRFIPNAHAKDEKTETWVQYFDYFFQGPSGKWYFEKSPASIGLPDPVYESNGELYATKEPANIAIAKTRKRQNHIITNILVIKDYNNPDNDGKVFLYEMKKTTLNHISGLMTPEFEDETPIFPYDIDNGANYKLVVFRNKEKAPPNAKEGLPDYSKSTFEGSSPLASTDEEINEILKKTYDLSEFIAPESFKSYDELASRFAEVTKSKSKRVERDLEEAVGMNDVEEFEAKYSKSSKNAKDDIDEFDKLFGDDDEIPF